MQLSCGKSYIAILMKLKEGEKASWSHCELKKSHIIVILFKNLDLIQYSLSFLQNAEPCFKVWMLINNHLNFYWANQRKKLKAKETGI